MPAGGQDSGYILALHFYSRDDVLPLSSTGSQWLLASVVYDYKAGFIIAEQLDGRGGRRMEWYSIEPALLEVLERELALRGLELP